MSQIGIRRGDPLILRLRFTDEHRPVDLSGVALSGQVRSIGGKLIASLPVAVSYDRGVADIEIDDTTSWPLGRLNADIKLVSGAISVHTETFTIKVAEGVTQ